MERERILCAARHRILVVLYLIETNICVISTQVLNLRPQPLSAIRKVWENSYFSISATVRAFSAGSSYDIIISSVTAFNSHFNPPENLSCFYMEVEHYKLVVALIVYTTTSKSVCEDFHTDFPQQN